MPRPPIHELEAELDRFRRERSTLDQATTKLLAFEAAIRVLARHDLIVEFASELSSIATASPQPS